MNHALGIYTGVHTLHAALERQGDTHGAVAVCLDGLDASQVGDLVRLVADGIGIHGRDVNRPGSGSSLVDDPLGGCSMHLDLRHLTLSLGVINVTDVQRSILASMLRALSCGRCGTPLTWGDYEHHSGGACFDCYHDALADAVWEDSPCGSDE